MNKSSLTNRNIARFGAIIFKFSIFGFILTIIALLSVLLTELATVIGIFGLILYYFILIIIALFTLFTIFLSEDFRKFFSDKPIKKFNKISEFMLKYSSQIMNAVPYLALGTSILAIISFICLMFDRKWEKSKNRLITLGIIVLTLIILVILIITGTITAK